MRTFPLIIALILFFACPSCYYRNHMPTSSASDLAPEIVEMKVGEKRKIRSKTSLAEISPGFMPGPALSLKSSNPRVVTIEGGPLDPVAWAMAVAPGTVAISHAEGEILTRIIVLPGTDANPAP